MLASDTRCRTALAAGQWRLLGLLAVAAFINYFDRATLSFGATDIQRDLHLSNYQLGLLLSAFFWTYATLQLCSLAGWLVDRFNVGWVLAAGFFVWSVATGLVGAANSFIAAFSFRLLLGMGESVAYPSQSRLLALQFPEHHRAFANAVTDAGSKVGPALGALVGGLLMTRYGWRTFFLAQGFVGMLWLIPWYYWMPRGSGPAVREDLLNVPGTAAVLRHRAAWFTAGGLFCSNYFLYFLLTWLPSYLEKERGFPKSKMAIVASLAFLVIGASTVVSGYLSDRWVERGASPTRVRKTFVGTGLALSAMILPVAILHDETIAMILLLIACIAFGVYSSNVLAITQTLAGPRAVGTWTSFQNGFGNLAGVAAPWFTGWAVQTTGTFQLAFVAATLIVVLGAAMFVVGLGPIEQVHFSGTHS